MVKRTDSSAFANVRAGGIIALGIDEGDELVGGEDHRRQQGHPARPPRTGMSIRFPEEEVALHGPRGLRREGHHAEDGDEVVGADVVEKGATILTVTENGYGKRTEETEYRLQGRGGKGIIDIKTTERNGKVVGVRPGERRGRGDARHQRRDAHPHEVTEISVIGRNTQGVRLIQLEEGDHLVSVARLAEREEGEEGGPPRPDARGPRARRRHDQAWRRGTGGGRCPRGRRPAGTPRRASSISTSTP